MLDNLIKNIIFSLREKFNDNKLLAKSMFNLFNELTEIDKLNIQLLVQEEQKYLFASSLASEAVAIVNFHLEEKKTYNYFLNLYNREMNRLIPSFTRRQVNEAIQRYFIN